MLCHNAAAAVNTRLRKIIAPVACYQLNFFTAVPRQYMLHNSAERFSITKGNAKGTVQLLVHGDQRNSVLPAAPDDLLDHRAVIHCNGCDYHCVQHIVIDQLEY